MISPSQRPLRDNTQHSQQTNIHAPGGIRTHNLSRRAAADLRLRPRGHWGRLYYFFVYLNHRVIVGIIYISDGYRSRAYLIIKRCLLKSYLVMRVFVPKGKEVTGDGHSCVMTNSMLRTCRLSLACPRHTAYHHVACDVVYLVHMNRRFREICCLRHQDRSTVSKVSHQRRSFPSRSPPILETRCSHVDRHLQNY